MWKKYPYLEESYRSSLKDNPYLENPYDYNLNKEQQKRHFLSQLDNFVNQRQYINMTLLDWQERPLKEIDGVISSGTISKDGSSSVRRTASLSCSVDGGFYNLNDLNMDFSLNKKIFIEIGVKNDTDQYPDWPILWFPQGVFYIDSFSMNSSTSSAVNINLNLKDKMCLLNGDVGGKLPASIQFDTMTTQLETGEETEQKVLYYNIINELVNHWGGEDLSNIIIQDVPLRIRRVMAWNGENPLWLIPTEGTAGNDNIGEATFQVSLETQEEGTGATAYYQGDDVGYVYADFVPPSEIVGSLGDSVCTILDTIKNQLGNYEYFYDVFGIFHFREIKNYLNITQANIIQQETGNVGRYVNLEEGQFLLDTGSELQYLVETTNEKTMYSFTDSTNITSINVTPSYNNIKNDFIINGLKQSTSSDQQLLIRYRCVIDEKPEPDLYLTWNDTSKTYNQINDWSTVTNYIAGYGPYYNLIYYTHPERSGDTTVLETNRLGKAFEVDTELPLVGNMDQIYSVVIKEGRDKDGNRDKSQDVRGYKIWTGKKYEDLYLKEDLKADEDKQEIKSPEVYTEYIAQDWRTALYIQGLEANVNGTDPGPYFEELFAYWPQEYDVKKDHQYFFGQKENGSIQYKSLTQGLYFFDMIDASTSSLGDYSVQNIGRRIDTINEDDINCLFRPEIPNIIFLNKDNPQQNWSENTALKEQKVYPSSLSKLLQEQRQECIDNAQPWVQVSNDIYANLIQGGYSNSAYEVLRYELFSHTKYQRVVSITSLPAFYLEPNSRVEVSDHSTNTFGDFMVQNISLSLGPGANMTVNLNEVSERL